MVTANGDGSIILTTKIDESGIKDGFSSIKSGAAALGKGVAVVGAAAATAFVGLTTAAVKSYADFEQLTGGVKTLFGTEASSVEEYAQQVGKSVDEIRGEYDGLQAAQNTVLQNAQEAYKTAGLSANDYMESVTSFAASLKQSFDDTPEGIQQAADAANQAVIDMADNANKMGTSMDSIQQAYQGFAKQNYTMLDNLKLGYGGTKTEMERLLADAEKITGVKYDINNLNDVYSAIHVIQDDLGITGTTAREASETISGSFASMKGAFENFTTALANPDADMGAAMDALIDSALTFGENVFPIIVQASTKIPQAITQALPTIIQAIVGATPQILEGIMNVFESLVDALPAAFDMIVSALPQLIEQIVSALPSLIPELILGITDMVVTLVESLPDIILPLIESWPEILTLIIQALIQAFPMIIEALVNALPTIITALVQELIENLPILISGLIQLVGAIVVALPQIISGLLEALGQIATMIGQKLFEVLPGPVQDAFREAWELVKVVWDKVQPYFEAIWNAIKAVFSVVSKVLGDFFKLAWMAIKVVWDTVTGYFSAIWESIAGIFRVVKDVLSGNWQDAWVAIKGIVSTWVNFFRNIWSQIKAVFSSVASTFTGWFTSAWVGIKNAWSGVKAFFSNIWTQIKSVFTNAVSQFGSIGRNMIEGLWKGISNAKDWLLGKIKEWCGSVLNGIKSFFGIASPAKKMIPVGEMIVAGMSVGIERATDYIKDAFATLFADMRTEVQKIADEGNSIMLESEKRYAEEAARIERERAEAEWNEKVKNAKSAEELQKLTLEREKEMQKQAEDDYIKSLKDAADQDRKLYEARLKDTENAKQKLLNSYKEMADGIIKAIEDIEKQEASMADKLKKSGDLFAATQNKYASVSKPYKDGTKQLANLGSQAKQIERYGDLLLKLKERGDVPREFFEYVRDMNFDESFAFAQRMMSMSDKQFKDYVNSWVNLKRTEEETTQKLYADEAKGSRVVLSDLDAQTDAMVEYYDTLEALKNRTVLPEGFFDQIRDMDMTKGLQYASALMELTDSEFTDYLNSWQKKQETANDISKLLYKDDVDNLKAGLTDSFAEATDQFFDFGTTAGMEFENGFFSVFKDVGNTLQKVFSGFDNSILSIDPSILQSPLMEGRIVPTSVETGVTPQASGAWMDEFTDRLISLLNANRNPIQINFTGDLAQLARILQPELDREQLRQGTAYVTVGGAG